MAEVACPPSPFASDDVTMLFPLPANVEMIPAAETSRILPFSVKYTTPTELAHTSSVELIVALVAAPPSPVLELVPVPAKVLMIPTASTLLTRAFLSAIKTKPVVLPQTPSLPFSIAALAGPPSPL